MMKFKAVGVAAVMALLTACGGSSSGSGSGSAGDSGPGSDVPFLPGPSDQLVTLPDGTVIKRPAFEDIDPDNVPIELELEYEVWVLGTAHLRDPRRNVYEFVLTKGGVESREYLAFDWVGVEDSIAYALTDTGQCYSRPTADSLNGPLHGSVVKLGDGKSHAFELRLNLLDTYVDNSSVSASNWHLRWLKARNGLINEIQLVDNDGDVVARATSKEEALEYVLEDGGLEVSINVPFEPVDNQETWRLLDNVCPRETGDPVVYEGFTVEYKFSDGTVEDQAFSYASLLKRSKFEQEFFGIWNESFDDRYIYVGFIEQENVDRDGHCIVPGLLIDLNHDYRSGGFVGLNSWSDVEGSQKHVFLKPDGDGVIAESSDPQLSLTPADISFDDLIKMWCDY